MLKKYREKRDFTKTPEPSGKKKLTNRASSVLTFVVQEHAATRLHFDFRLEANGVLLSWAVPKGPSLNPQEKRLAVMTEDHPLDYAGFEGIIPSGYGAGEVIVWDNGTYAPMDDDQNPVDNRKQAEELIKKGLKIGKFSFYLEGKKLKGIWTLVRLKQKEKDWLLIKHEDKFAKEKGHPWKDKSVLSGQTLEDLQSEKKSPTKQKLEKKSKKQKTASLVIKTTSRKTPQKESVQIRHKKTAGKKTAKIVLPKFEPPMLATLTTDAFDRKDWLCEPKLDGIRALSYVDSTGVEIRSRRGLSITHKYPLLTNELSQYKNNFVIDGEIVAFDKNNRPSFEKLQERSGLTKLADIKIAEAKNPICYYVFDIIFLNGKDLRHLPLFERKKYLHQVIKPSKHIKVIEELGSNGKAAFEACIENGLEGIVTKRLDSTYQSNRRSPDWLKIKTTWSDEFLICGFTEGAGSRKDAFGALILGEYKSGKLKHVCSVGTGFNTKSMAALLKRMKPLQTSRCPFEKRPIGLDNPTWLKPEFVTEIKFAERTKDNSLRVPVFLHLREDIDPKKVKPKPIVEASTVLSKVNSKSNKKRTSMAKALAIKNTSTRRAVNRKANSDIEQISLALDNDEENLELTVEGNTLTFSHLNKSFWPSYNKHKSLTKRDYLRYLVTVSPWLLPHLKNRIITLIRFPQGIKGIKFFQRHWDEHLPKFVETVKVYTEHEKRDQNFLMCNNLSTLLWLGQIADLELHSLHTRIDPLPDGKKLSIKFTGSVKNVEDSLLNYPDYMVFDLDPYLYSGGENKGEEPELHRKGFKETCKVALWLKEILDQLSIKSFVKTSGKTGLHIYIPIKRNIDYDSVREFSQTIGQYMLEKHSDKVTMDWSVVKRKGKVFFDHNMNARSKSLASIYSPRVSKEACVSTPLDWDELEKIYPTDFTMESISERLKQKGDPWSDILSHKNDLSELLKSKSPSAKSKNTPVSKSDSKTGAKKKSKTKKKD